jgi:hypothetical protein
MSVRVALGDAASAAGDGDQNENAEAHDRAAGDSTARAPLVLDEPATHFGFLDRNLIRYRGRSERGGTTIRAAASAPSGRPPGWWHAGANPRALFWVLRWRQVSPAGIATGENHDSRRSGIACTRNPGQADVPWRPTGENGHRGHIRSIASPHARSSGPPCSEGHCKTAGVGGGTWGTHLRAHPMPAHPRL